MTLFINHNDTNFEKKIQSYFNKIDIFDFTLNKKVKKILKNVKNNDDKALIKYSKKFDNYDPSIKGFYFEEHEIENFIEKIPEKQKNALNFARERIFDYHKLQLPKKKIWIDKEGVELGWKWSPLESVGIYVPGGTASYPSSVLMNAIPANVAGVKNIYMTSPTPHSIFNPLILYAAKISGVKKIFKIGGAQAIGAFAFSTKSVPKVNKIVGPGNAFVAEAKKQVYGNVGIDMFAGPSEVLVLGDETANPEWIAIDLLSQAEHDENAKCTLITNSELIGNKVKKEINKLINSLKRKEIAKKSWYNNGAIIIIKNITQAIDIINLVAPEHLQLCIKEPEAILEKIKNAGSIFCGSWTPEAIGDYVGGPNHVLPTSKSAKFSSGLSVLDFLKRSSILKLNKESMKSLGPNAEIIANSEGLDAHARSISMRIKK